MRPVRWIVGTIPAWVLIAVTGLVACDNASSSGGSVATPPSAAAPSSVAVSPPAPTVPAQPVTEDDSVNEALRDYHRHHHGGADDVHLDGHRHAGPGRGEEERRSRRSRAIFAPRRRPPGTPSTSCSSTIADGVAAGKIDTAKVDAAVEKVATASTGIHAATADALTQLHDVLSPAERAALVDKVKAHWEVWHKVNVDEKAGNKDKGGAPRAAHRAAHPHARPGRQDQRRARDRRARDAEERSEGGGRAHPGLRDGIRGRQVRSEGARVAGDRRRPVTSPGTAGHGWRASTRRSRPCSRRSSARSLAAHRERLNGRPDVRGARSEEP